MQTWPVRVHAGASVPCSQDAWAVPVAPQAGATDSAPCSSPVCSLSQRAASCNPSLAPPHPPKPRHSSVGIRAIPEGSNSPNTAQEMRPKLFYRDSLTWVEAAVKSVSLQWRSGAFIRANFDSWWLYAGEKSTAMLWPRGRAFPASLGPSGVTLCFNRLQQTPSFVL